MRPLLFHRLATREITRAYRWYEFRNPDAARRFEEATEDAVQRIVSMPDTHPIEFKMFRWVRVRGFPYRLIYRRLDDGCLIVVAVSHTSRRPGYWRRRRMS